MAEIDASELIMKSPSNGKSSDSRDVEIQRLRAELVRTKEQLLVALDAVAGAEAEMAEAKGKQLEFLREIQARDSDIHKMNVLMPELQHQADVAHHELAEITHSSSFKAMSKALVPYRKLRNRLGR